MPNINSYETDWRWIFILNKWACNACDQHAITPDSHYPSSRMEYPLQNQSYQKQGAVSIRKTVLSGMAIPMLKIRRPNGRLIFNMEIAIRR